MQLNFNVKDKNLIVRFNGEIDHHTAQGIRREIEDKYKGNMLRNIILDFNGVNFMDSSGIGLIMGRYKTIKSNNGKMAMINVNSRLEKIFKMSGILKIVNKYKNEEEALNNI